jgi:hypothetical protein
MDTTPLFDLSPLASLLLLATLLALGPLAWVWWRGGAEKSLLAKRHALTVWVGHRPERHPAARASSEATNVAVSASSRRVGRNVET